MEISLHLENHRKRFKWMCEFATCVLLYTEMFQCVCGCMDEFACVLALHENGLNVCVTLCVSLLVCGLHTKTFQCMCECMLVCCLYRAFIGLYKEERSLTHSRFQRSCVRSYNHIFKVSAPSSGEGFSAI